MLSRIHQIDNALSFGAACAIQILAISRLSWIERGGDDEPDG
jgi:hypothetical protein